MEITEVNLETGEASTRPMTQDELEAVAVPSDPGVPEAVSLFQAKAALLIYGAQIGRPNLLDEVNALVNGLQAGVMGLTEVEARVIKTAWDTAQEVRRDSPSLAMIFPALGLTLPEQLDAMFIIAAGVKA